MGIGMEVYLCVEYTTSSITLLLGSKPETVLVKQLCYIQSKMYRLYSQLTIYGHFSI